MEVLKLMVQEGGPHGVSAPTGVSLDTVVEMFTSLDRLVRLLMANSYPVGGKDTISLHIIYFLNCSDALKPVPEDRKFPEWLTAYSFCAC